MPTQAVNPWLAVSPVGDRLEQAIALRRVHEAFQAGRDVAGSVRAVVARSWARSQDAGVDPESHLARIVMDDREIEDRWSHHPLYPVLPMLRDLLSGATSESSHMLVISDARGVLMWIEGHHRVIEATQNMHFVCGADWSESGAGTNALGTAIAVDHPVQIFSAEHFNRVVHPWQCSGAPIHDPQTGEILGVVDLTGHLRSAHPHTLALVTAAAGMAEAYLSHDLQRREEALRAAYLERIAGAKAPTALIGAGGRVLMDIPRGWVGEASIDLEPGRELTLASGAVADIEPLSGNAGFVLWRRRTGTPAPSAPAGVRLELMAQPPRVITRSGEVELSPRHAEILAVLMLAGRGLNASELSAEVYGERGVKPVTLRAEMSRLRRALGGVLGARPYRFRVPVRSDLQDAQVLLDEDRPADALALSSERLLAWSDAALVVGARKDLERRLGAAVLDSDEQSLSEAWSRSACHQQAVS
jgi:hypothetical protein